MMMSYRWRRKVVVNGQCSKQLRKKIIMNNTIIMIKSVLYHIHIKIIKIMKNNDNNKE